MSVYERSPKSIFLLWPKFQFKFLSYFVGLFIITTASLYSATFIFFWNLHKKAIAVGIPEDHVFHQFIANQKADIDVLFVGLAVMNLLLLLGMGFLISHRIAGPLKKMMGHLTGANDEEFHLREKDFFQELVPIVNDVKRKIK